MSEEESLEIARRVYELLAAGLKTASGVGVEGRFAHLLSLRDGRVLRTEVYTDRSKALEAAGLEE